MIALFAFLLLANSAARADYMVSGAVSSMEYLSDGSMNYAGNQIGGGYGIIQYHSFVATASFGLGPDTSRITGITLVGTIDGYHDPFYGFSYHNYANIDGTVRITEGPLLSAGFHADDGVAPTQHELDEYGPATGPDFHVDFSSADLAAILTAVQFSGGGLSLDLSGDGNSSEGRGAVGYLEQVGLIVYEAKVSVPEPSGLALAGFGGLIVLAVAAHHRSAG